MTGSAPLPELAACAAAGAAVAAAHLWLLRANVRLYLAGGRGGGTGLLRPVLLHLLRGPAVAALLLAPAARGALPAAAALAGFTLGCLAGAARAGRRP
jgi:hypothetical protein